LGIVSAGLNQVKKATATSLAALHCFPLSYRLIFLVFPHKP
jgi:hypothetical protein